MSFAGIYNPGAATSGGDSGLSEQEQKMVKMVHNQRCAEQNHSANEGNRCNQGWNHASSSLPWPVVWASS